MAEVQQVLLAETPFEEGTRIHARRGMALIVNKVARLVSVARPEEVIKPDFAERGERSVGRNMATDVGIVLIGSNDHGGRVPANQTFNSALHRTVAGVRHLFMRRDGIHVRRTNTRRGDSKISGSVEQLFKQIVGPVRAKLV